MKKLLVLAFVALSACGGERPATIPNPPQNTNVVEVKVPVPVLCEAEIRKARIIIDQAREDLELEEQNAILRQTIAEQQAYIRDLEAGIIGCGGKIKD